MSRRAEAVGDALEKSATAWLLEALRAGEMLGPEVLSRAEAAGHPRDVVKRAIQRCIGNGLAMVTPQRTMRLRLAERAENRTNTDELAEVRNGGEVRCGECDGSGYGAAAVGFARCDACRGRGIDHAATQTALLRAILVEVRRWGR